MVELELKDNAICTAYIYIYIHTIWGAEVDVDVLVYLEGVEDRPLG
jgi:hypothetical protein